MPSTNPGAHDPDEVEAIVSGEQELPEHVRPDGTLDDPPPLPQAKRRRLVHRVTRRWALLLVVAAVLVVTAIVGLAVGGDDRTGRTVLFTAMGLIGALLALASTVWRGKVGDDLDEAKL